MCGINGFVSKNYKETKIMEGILDEMNHEIIHRGPDQDGFFTENSTNFSIGMAMRRLSIIDLSTGKQPIFSSDNQKLIVFNGEIYNYKSLKHEHLKDYDFKTHSDTEVIIALYEKYGVASFSLLDGMFAFSIYDKTKNKVYIARDFFGEKPLYYTLNVDTFYWCSELKSMLKVLSEQPKINKQAVNLYFQLTYIPSPYTIYEGIHKLNANHYLELDCESLLVQECAIPAIDYPSYRGISKQEATRVAAQKVRHSVQSRSISDVPLGTFLSGGVDSSIISLCLAEQSSQKIDTFSIGFEKKGFDESDKSRIVANIIGSHHHEFIISEQDIQHDLHQIILNFDEPFADSSALPTYLVSNRVSKHVKVALTGDGGDEVFGGYNKYYMGRLNEKYTNFIPKKFHQSSQRFLEKILQVKEDSRGMKFKVNRLIKAINYEGDFYTNIISLGFQAAEMPQLLTPDYLRQDSFTYYKNSIGNRKSSLTDFRNIDRLLSLEGDLLVKVDRVSMMNSIECRAPFLNKELWDFSSQLPESYLINGWDKKHLLKEAFKDHFPKGFLNKSKKGFGVPVGDWLRTNLKDELVSYIEPYFIQEQRIFQYEVVSKMVQEHVLGQVDNTFRVWTFYCFQLWYKNTFQNHFTLH
nr:asparagine synthase (glutamine-hydrolyzing) [uncultured Flavobacterium sp.]